MGKKLRIGLLVAGGALFLFLSVALSLRKGSPGPKCRYWVVREGEVVAVARATGQIKARVQVEVGPEVVSRIEKIFVAEGDTVRAGDTLCLLDPSIQSSQVRAAEARLLSAKARLRTAERAYLRAKTLYEKGLISQSQMEEAEANYRSLLAQVEAERAALEQARAQLGKTVILSPVDAVVVSVLKEAGEEVVPGTMGIAGSVIMVLADMSQVMVEGEVEETQVPAVRPGQRVEVTLDAWPDTSVWGVVKRRGGSPIESQGTYQTGVFYPVEVLLSDPPGGLLPGMSASLEIITGQDSGVVVSLAALGKHDGKTVVWKYQDGRACRVPVEVGLRGDSLAIVISGLSPGDTVLTGPPEVLRSLRDSSRVKLVEPKRKGRKGK